MRENRIHPHLVLGRAVDVLLDADAVPQTIDEHNSRPGVGLLGQQGIPVANRAEIELGVNQGGRRIVQVPRGEGSIREASDGQHPGVDDVLLHLDGVGEEAVVVEGGNPQRDIDQGGTFALLAGGRRPELPGLVAPVHRVHRGTDGSPEGVLDGCFGSGDDVGDLPVKC